MCVQTQRSSEEAFVFSEVFRFVAQAAPQTHFGKTFWILASFFWDAYHTCMAFIRIESALYHLRSTFGQHLVRFWHFWIP